MSQDSLVGKWRPNRTRYNQPLSRCLLYSRLAACFCSCCDYQSGSISCRHRYFYANISIKNRVNATNDRALKWTNAKQAIDVFLCKFIALNEERKRCQHTVCHFAAIVVPFVAETGIGWSWNQCGLLPSTGNTAHNYTSFRNSVSLLIEIVQPRHQANGTLNTITPRVSQLDFE